MEPRLGTSYQQTASSSRRELLEQVQKEGIELVGDLQPLPEELAAEALRDHRESVVAEYCGDDAKAKRHRNRCDAFRRVGRDLRRDAPPTTLRKPQARAQRPRGRARAAKVSRSNRSRRSVSSRSSDPGGGEPPADPTTLVVSFDGASENPGRSAWGIVAERGGEIVASYGEATDHGTCNTAEAAGLVAALKEAKKQGAQRVRIIGDSKLVVNQANGHWKVKDASLKGYHREARALMREFVSVEVLWVARDFNQLAHETADAAFRGPR